VIYMIIMAILALLVAIFALQNTMVVELTFLAWSFTTNLVVVIIGAAVMGMIIASLWGLKLKAQHMWRNMKKNNEISGLEEERNLLRKKVEQLTADNAKFKETIKQSLQSLDGTKTDVKPEVHKQ
jgi:putative membrane protein